MKSGIETHSQGYPHKHTNKKQPHINAFTHKRTNNKQTTTSISTSTSSYTHRSVLILATNIQLAIQQQDFFLNSF